MTPPRGPMRIALLGTRGVPARSGGIETCVEEVGARLADRGHQVVVYGRRSDVRSEPAPVRYRGMTLVQHKWTAQSVAHLALHRVDAAIVFRPANAPWLPLLRAARVRFATHVDGLEAQRAGQGYLGRRLGRVAERMSAAWSPALIADSVVMQRHYREKYGADSDLIGYGAPDMAGADVDRIAELGLEPGGYHLVVARFQLENNLHVMVDGYRRSGGKRTLVVVGAVDPTDTYTRAVQALAGDQVRFLGAVLDPELLDQLYTHAASYLHGHSAGGTLSLLRALAAGTAVEAFDADLNREVLGESGWYFRTADDLAELMADTEADESRTSERAQDIAQLAGRYRWDDVTDRYEQLCRTLASGRR